MKIYLHCSSNDAEILDLSIVYRKVMTFNQNELKIKLELVVYYLIIDDYNGVYEIFPHIYLYEFSRKLSYCIHLLSKRRFFIRVLLDVNAVCLIFITWKKKFLNEATF